MKKNKIIFIVALIIIFLIGIFTYGYFEYLKKNNEKESNENKVERIKVITTIFPTYDFAKNILGDKGDVRILLKPGIEPHAFEPTPNDIKEINNSDIFIYTNDIMEPWALKIINQAEDNGVKIIDASDKIKLIKDDDSHYDHDDDHGHNSMFDPHVWLDPINAKKMVENISSGIISLDSINKKEYSANTKKYLRELDVLDKEIKRSIPVRKHDIFFAGHNTFGYFADRYNIDIDSVYLGFSPNSEPSAKRVSEMIKEIKEEKVKYLFHEEFISPEIAKTISEETGTKLEILHSVHNLTKEEFEAGKTYIGIMNENLIKIVKGLRNE